ncbi:MAG: sulfatase-like hydrolase/transferase [Pirellulaceae bacterium]
MFSVLNMPSGIQRDCSSLQYRKTSLLGMLMLAACVAHVVAPHRAAADQASRPNILFIFADDQSYETLGVAGNRVVQTPNLDALAARGTRFSQCFNMGSWSGAVCVASRTMLNSGRYLWRAEAIYKQSDQEREAGRWWSEYMRRAGYKTYMTGKWHCRASAEKSFDVTRHVRGGMPNQTPEGYDRPKSADDNTWSPSDPKFGGFWEGGKHWSEVVADDAIDYLNEAGGANNPFFMYIAFNAPHDPRQSPQSYVDRYPVESIPVPEDFLPLYPFKDKIGLGKSLRDEALGVFPRTRYCVQVHRQEYYAIISHMDAQIGRVLDRLKESKQADNTWVFFTADHGLACGHHGLMGKQNMYDHSLRVPFVVVPPGEQTARVIDDPIYLQSVMPTTLELAAVDRPEHVEFQSLLPVLNGKPSQIDVVYGAYLDLQRCVRTDRHKLIVYPKAEAVRLYDLKNDPQEMHDLADRPESLPIMRELFAELLKKQSQLGDQLDLEKTLPQLTASR